MVFEGQAEIVDSLLKEIFEIVNPCGLEGTFVLLIRGYMDESYDIGKKLFLLSALVGTGHGFGWIDSNWKKCLDDRNGELISEGRKPMTRFHAAECNALDGEYKGWTRPEQIKFMQNLIKVLGKAELDSVAFALDLGPYFKFFPEKQELSQAELLSNLYGVMTKFVVYNLAPQYVAADPSVRISLIYDHSEYDGVMADAFRKAIQYENFRDRSCYTSITPASSVDVRPAANGRPSSA